ncbi:MAG: hypothetical protein OXF47_03280 [Nitrospira sp.]|nr:hypothetical protein [Nitrospira sp.]
MDIHVLYPLRRRQPRQDSPYPPYQIGGKLSAIVFFKIPLQAPMLKTADHFSTVACNEAHVNNSFPAASLHVVEIVPWPVLAATTSASSLMAA